MGFESKSFFLNILYVPTIKLYNLGNRRHGQTFGPT